MRKSSYDVTAEGYIKINDPADVLEVIAQLWRENPTAGHIDLHPTSTPTVYWPIVINEGTGPWWIAQNENGLETLFVVQFDEYDRRV